MKEFEQSTTGWRLKLGVALFILSILLPLIGIPIMLAVDLSETITASLTGALLLGSEVIGIIAVAVMGKSGYVYFKNIVFGMLKQYAPPEVVSRRRYTIGLIMFTIPVVFGWFSVYAAEWIPGFIQNPFPYAIGGDLILLASLFTLGGNFWDKIRALFIYDSSVQF